MQVRTSFNQEPLPQIIHLQFHSRHPSIWSNNATSKTLQVSTHQTLKQLSLWISRQPKIQLLEIKFLKWNSCLTSFNFSRIIHQFRWVLQLWKVKILTVEPRHLFNMDTAKINFCLSRPPLPQSLYRIILAIIQPRCLSFRSSTKWTTAFKAWILLQVKILPMQLHRKRVSMFKEPYRLPPMILIIIDTNNSTSWIFRLHRSLTSKT